MTAPVSTRVRPHRHLCPEADERDAMTDPEFWEHVLRNLTPQCGFDDDVVELDPQIDAPPCPVCGSPGACAYDAEGRALIHTTDDEDPEND